MTSLPLVPSEFDPPRLLVTDQFVGATAPNTQADHAAWTSSIDHIRSTRGYPDGDSPPVEGMSLEENLADLEMHARDFAADLPFTAPIRAIGCDRCGSTYLLETDCSMQSAGPTGAPGQRSCGHRRGEGLTGVVAVDVARPLWPVTGNR